jgi:glycosyltransferase involved in cell wall biosynthesis
MRILLWHGYLLRGTGSNIYKANVVRAWRAHGHEVILLCQERSLQGLDFVDDYGEFASDNSSFEVASTGISPGSGRVTLIRPDIGDILPVYVYDEYEGFTAKRYVDLTDAELAHYVDTNVAAMNTAIERFAPDAIFTSHEVMGPYIASMTGAPYVAQLHGSALEYAVKEEPERFLEYAAVGLNGATRVTGGSEYMVEAASAVVPGWRARAAVVNPGCDIEIFRPPRTRDNRPPVVGYVGKFITQKGVHNLLCALPLIPQRVRAVIVGFGDLDADLRVLWTALQNEDRAEVQRIAQNAHKGPLQHVLDFVLSGRATGEYFSRARNVELEFPGRLDHGPLSQILPTFDVLVVPSILPEAFGMVAAEAAACGVLPVVPNHSGIGEIGAALEDAIGRPGLLTYDPERPIEGIASRTSEILDLSGPEREECSRSSVELARERWSWDTVAATLLRVATDTAG